MVGNEASIAPTSLKQYSLFLRASQLKVFADHTHVLCGRLWNFEPCLFLIDSILRHHIKRAASGSFGKERCQSYRATDLRRTLFEIHRLRRSDGKLVHVVVSFSFSFSGVKPGVTESSMTKPIRSGPSPSREEQTAPKVAVTDRSGQGMRALGQQNSCLFGWFRGGREEESPFILDSESRMPSESKTW